jgi:hypothetical protein
MDDHAALSRLRCIHVVGATAVVFARSAPRPGTFNRYVDTYVRRGHGWLCALACVWPLQATAAPEE